MFTPLQQRAIEAPAAYAHQVSEGGWNHFEDLPPRAGVYWEVRIGLTLNR